MRKWMTRLDGALGSMVQRRREHASGAPSPCCRGLEAFHCSAVRESPTDDATLATLAQNKDDAAAAAGSRSTRSCA